MSSQESPPEQAFTSKSETRMIMKKFVHIWTIERFSLYTKEGFNAEKYFCITSSRFGLPSHQFYLKLYPVGLNEENKDHISLFLVSAKVCTVSYKFALSEDGEQSFMKVSIIRQFKSTEEWGFGKYIAHQDLFNPANHLLKDDKLTIFCEVEVIDGPESSLNPSHNLEQFAQSSIAQVSADLDRLLINRRFADIVLTLDGKDIPAHKSILGARSPVFAAYFAHPTSQESRDGRVNIVDIDADVFGAFLHYIYTGRVESMDKYAPELLQIADKYEVLSLKAHCEQYLIAKMTPDSAIANLILADYLRVKTLKDAAIQCIVKNAAEILRDDKDFTALKPHPELLMEVIRGLVGVQQSSSSNLQQPSSSPAPTDKMEKN